MSRRAAQRVADALGRGTVAGVLGTAAMTVSSTLEARLSGRGSSSTPADAVSTVLRVQPSEQGQKRLNTLAHWGYGAAWGGVRGLLGLIGLPGPVATALHLGAVWGTEQAMLPALKVGSPVWKYGGAAVGTDALHHTVYATATGLAYGWLDRS